MLKRLHVKNLGPIAEAVLDDRAPVTLLLGQNESGKTTLLEALNVLYFGTRGGVAVGDNKALTRDGAKGWAVNATIGEANLDATRSKRPLQEECRAALGDPRVFRSLTFARYFLAMMPAERKALLADLHATDTDDLYERLEGLGAPAPVLAAVRAGNMKKAHAEAVEARRAAGRILKAAEATRDAEVLDPEVETKQGKLHVSKLPLATIEQSIERLRSRRDKVVSNDARRRSQGAMRAAAEQAQKELDSLAAEGTWATADESRLTAINEEVREWNRKANVATGEIGAASKADLELKALVKSLSPGEMIPCPTCTRPIDSEEADEALKNVHAESAGVINRAKAVQKEAAENTSKLSEERAGLAKRKADVERTAQFRTRLEAQVAAADDLDEGLEESATTPEVYDGEIKRVTRMRDLRRDYERARLAREHAEVKAVHAQTQVDEMARLEVLCDPAAMDNEEDALAQLNALLKRTTGKLGALVEISPGFEVTVQGRAPGLAADSIIVRAGFGVGCALSVIAGVGLALLDRFESLDAAGRKRALGMVKGLVDDGLLSTVLIAAVKDEPVRGADVPWLAWVKVADGTVEYL